MACRYLQGHSRWRNKEKETSELCMGNSALSIVRYCSLSGREKSPRHREEALLVGKKVGLALGISEGEKSARQVGRVAPLAFLGSEVRESRGS